MDILINNAGFGRQGEFVERSLEADLGMIDLNVKTLVALTHLVADDMIEQGSGKILHVGSTAGFMLGPLQATYFATKAFVNSFSQAAGRRTSRQSCYVYCTRARICRN